MKTKLAPLPDAETIDPTEIRRSWDEGKIELVCVLGPTASGKTKYAIRLAHDIGGEIISADSRQVYRRMDIGTGKDLLEYGDIPSHLIDIRNAGEQYNVHDFQEDFSKAFELIRAHNKIPILCGGTGLYISAVTSGYNWDGESRPLSSAKSDTSLNTYFIGTLVDREERNRRIDHRLDTRLKEGMVDEIRGLLESGIPAEKLISYGLEYKYVTEFILGQRDYLDMREKLAIAIHQFAKRQMTWFRGMERSGIKIHWTKV